METIKSYLDNVFGSLPQTEEIKGLKNEIYCNMEEKYHELKNKGKLENEAVGIVISEFGNINELLEEMNITPSSTSSMKEAVYPTISLEEAREFITLKGKTSYLIGIGVSLILLGVSLLIFLFQLIEDQHIFQTLSGDAQDTLPVIFLLLLVAPAVGLFIYSGTRLERFKCIEEGHFEISSATRAILNQELTALSPKQNIGTIIGVCLCVLSPLAIFIGSLFGDRFSVYGVCVLLLMIGTAVFILITTSSISEAYKNLLKLEEFSPIKKKENKVIGAVAGIIWPLATCIFLICGLVFELWHICWIVFPITGILFGGFCAFYSIIKSE